MTEEGNAKDFGVVYRPQDPYTAKAFDSTAFDLGKFAGRITVAIDSLAHGAVIAIDAPWGFGKTYFARNQDANLRDNGWKTAYVDAFAHDYIEDPFLLFAGLLKNYAASNKKLTFIQAATAVGKTLIPIAGKTVAKIATAGVFNDQAAEQVTKALADAAGDAASKVIEARIAHFEKDRESIDFFRAKVAELAAEVYADTGHPLVVFVDELDRCRPDFAVRTFERLKHFFEVPHLVFVLMLNRIQLQNAVNGIYGDKLDAEAYLRKFIHLNVSLPVRSSTKEQRDSELRRYPRYLGKKVNLGANQRQLDEFVSALTDYAGTMALSFREVERCFTEFVVLNMHQNFSPTLIWPLCFVIVLKVKYPELLQGLLGKDQQARHDVATLLTCAESRGLVRDVVHALDGMVSAHVGIQLNAEQANALREFIMHLRGPETAFQLLAKFVDQRFEDS